VTDHQADLLQGTLDLLILKTLTLGPEHGWGVSQRIQRMSRDVLQVNQGSLYPALHRLEQKGWIEAEWGTSENNRKAKFYSLTRRGRAQLEAERDQWERFSAAVARILEAADAGPLPETV
jgi:PadR family transcriptional regulator, regulatory protein PadR